MVTPIHLLERDQHWVKQLYVIVRPVLLRLSETNSVWSETRVVDSKAIT